MYIEEEDMTIHTISPILKYIFKKKEDYMTMYVT